MQAIFHRCIFSNWCWCNNFRFGSRLCISRPSAVNRFMILPKVTSTQRGNLTGVVSGAIIYNTSTNKVQVFNGSLGLILTLNGN